MLDEQQNRDAARAAKGIENPKGAENDDFRL
jgi:hypothetical protein